MIFGPAFLPLRGGTHSTTKFLRSVATARSTASPGRAVSALAITGSKVSPGLFESLELLGKDESLARLAAAGGGQLSADQGR